MSIIDFSDKYVALPLLLLTMTSCGIYFLFRLRLFSPKKTASMIRSLRSGESDGGISASSSLSVALAGTLGVGNISGVAVAISVGGAGAVFWMTVSAVLGASLKYCEAFLSVKFRDKTKKGAVGSPYYASVVSGKKTGSALAALCVLGSFLSGSFIQMNAASEAASVTYGVPRAAVGAVFAVICLLTALGGIKRVSSLTSVLMPVFCAVFAALSVIAISMKIAEIPGVICRIFCEAFGFSQAAGGFSGAVLSSAVYAGMTKGVFSHEAGCGTSSFSHGSSGMTDPSAQGLVGIAEVLFDTVVFGGMTALVILTADPSPSGSYNGTAAALSAYSCFFGGAAVRVLTVLTVFFAFASILCWGYYGTVCSENLKSGSSRVYLILYCASMIPGSIIAPSIIWRLSDLMLAALMAVNCAVMIRGRRYIT